MSHASRERDLLLPAIKHKSVADPQTCTEIPLVCAVVITCLELLTFLLYACISAGCRASILHDGQKIKHCSPLLHSFTWYGVTAK